MAEAESRLAGLGVPVPTDPARIRLLYLLLAAEDSIQSDIDHLEALLVALILQFSENDKLNPANIPIIRSRAIPLFREFSVKQQIALVGEIKTAAQYGIDSVLTDEELAAIAAAVIAAISELGGTTGFILAGEPLADHINRISQNAMSAVLKDVMRGALMDVSAQTIAKQLRVNLRGETVQGLAPGVAALQPNLFRTVADDYVSAYAAAQDQIIREAGLDVMLRYHVSGIYQDKKCNAVPKCGTFDGRLFTPQEAAGMLPRHSNCRCSFSVEPA